MRSRGRALLLALLSALAWAVPAGAEDAPMRLLRFNPFSRPELGAAGAPRQSARASGTAAWRPLLTATLVSGDASLANLGGVVLAVGEATHGYRLLEVRAWEAVFEHAGEEVVLQVAPGQGGER